MYEDKQLYSLLGANFKVKNTNKEVFVLNTYLI